MKIITPGMYVKSWTHQFKCYWCKSELEIVASDLKYSGERGDWHDAGWEKYEVQCPLCGTSNTIDNDTVPILVKVYAEKKSKGWNWFSSRFKVI